MFNSRPSKNILVASVLTLLSLGWSSLSAEGTGIEVFMPGDEKMYIVDTNSKKILIYQIKAGGLMLKEVRSFEGALKAPDFVSANGLSYLTEAKELAKALADKEKKEAK